MKVLLSGSDVQRYEMNDAFAFQNPIQKFRAVKAFEMTYVRVGGGVGLYLLVITLTDRENHEANLYTQIRARLLAQARARVQSTY